MVYGTFPICSANSRRHTPGQWGAGKATVYAIAAGIDPRQVLPVALDTGCDVDDVRKAPFYAGLARCRAR